VIDARSSADPTASLPPDRREISVPSAAITTELVPVVASRAAATAAAKRVSPPVCVAILALASTTSTVSSTVCVSETVT
jgi:hypothetical protein